MRLGFTLTIWFAFLAVVGHARQAPAPTVTVPVLSFVLDGTRGLRPLIGIAGAASVGPVRDLGFEIVQAANSSGHDYILATTSPDKRPAVVQIRGDAVTIRRLDLSGIDRIALSSSGSAAVLYSESDRRIYSFSNLPQSPTLLSTVELGALGLLTALAITDDGQTVAVGVSDGTAGSLFLLDAGQLPRLVASMRRPSAIRFLRKSDSAIIADDLDDTVFALSAGQVFVLATAEHGISGPVGIAISNDNEKVFVGNSRSGSVTTIESFGRIGETIYCDCALTGLHPTNTDSVFRLTDFSGRPILLFEGNASVPRITFVPMASQY